MKKTIVGSGKFGFRYEVKTGQDTVEFQHWYLTEAERDKGFKLEKRSMQDAKKFKRLNK